VKLRFFVLNFLPFVNYITLMWEKISVSLLFRIASNEKLGGAWNKATCIAGSADAMPS